MNHSIHLTLVLILGFTATAPALAFPRHKAQLEKLRGVEFQLQKGKDCTDFTGRWSGICTGDLGAFEDNLNAFQFGCDYLSAGEISMPINGLTTRNESYNSFVFDDDGKSRPSPWASNSIATLDWNKARTELHYRERTFSRSIGGPIGWELETEASVKIDDEDRLIYASNFLGEELKCTYHRQ